MQQREFANIGTATAYGLAPVASAGCWPSWDWPPSAKLEYSHVPKPLKGLGITFIVTAKMAIGFMSFSGINI